jgi:hypothetical protein
MEDLSYCLAVRFANGERAERDYGQLRLLLRRADCNLSVYRVLLDDVPHIIVLGERPDKALGKLLGIALAAGESVELPPTVLAALMARRETSRVRV